MMPFYFCAGFEQMSKFCTIASYLYHLQSTTYLTIHRIQTPLFHIFTNLNFLPYFPILLLFLFASLLPTNSPKNSLFKFVFTKMVDTYRKRRKNHQIQTFKSLLEHFDIFKTGKVSQLRRPCLGGYKCWVQGALFIIFFVCMSQRSYHSAEPATDNCKVYISNINKTIQQEDIRRKFQQFGTIKSLILKKKDNHVTYSFIEYQLASQAAEAIKQMDKKMFFDRVLKVQHGKGGHKGLEHYHSRGRQDRGDTGDYRPREEHRGSGGDNYHSQRRYGDGRDEYGYGRRRERSRDGDRGYRREDRARRSYGYDSDSYSRSPYSRSRSRSYSPRNRYSPSYPSSRYPQHPRSRSPRRHSKQNQSRYYQSRRNYRDYRPYDDNRNRGEYDGGRYGGKDRGRGGYERERGYQEERRREYTREERGDNGYSRGGDTYGRSNDGYGRANDNYGRGNDAYSRGNEGYSRSGDGYKEGSYGNSRRYYPQQADYNKDYSKPSSPPNQNYDQQPYRPYTSYSHTPYSKQQTQYTRDRQPQRSKATNYDVNKDYYVNRDNNNQNNKAQYGMQYQQGYNEKGYTSNNNRTE